MFANPLLYIAIGFVAMFLCAWLFDRAATRYGVQPRDAGTKPERPALRPLLIRQAAILVMVIAILFAAYKTHLLVADAILLAGCVAFGALAYRVRIKPLLAAGMQQAHLFLLVFALCLWALPFAMFLHLTIARSYGGH